MKRRQWSVAAPLRLIGASRFIWFIMAVLVVQALWIALSGRYPMAFDEDFHLGLIKLYAHHLNPFWDAQPPGADAYGALARDPSYLFQYLFSFVYRLISLFTSDQTIQVLILRFCNIALFASCLPLYRRLLLKTGASRTIVHGTLLVFVLIPVIPLLAAQINYDNLLLPLVAITLLLTLRLWQRTSRNYFDWQSLLLLLVACLLTSLVKYAFLPVFVAIVGCSAVYFWRLYHRSPAGIRLAAGTGWRALSRLARGGLLAALVVACILFGERYGINLVRYHTPVADCAQVLDFQHCQYYGPWLRDYQFAHTKGNVSHNPLRFSWEWAYGMWLRSYFAVDGPSTQFQTRGPLAVPGLSAVAFIGVGLAALILTAKRLWRIYNAPVLWLLGTASLIYVVVLWLDCYQLFVQTGRPVAINGRYLAPILPLGLILIALAVNELLARRRALKLLTLTAVLVCSLWGGGALTYILRSNDAWYWPHTPLKAANHELQRLLGPVTPGYVRPIEYMHY